jgi:hypothetical protein
MGGSIAPLNQEGLKDKGVFSTEYRVKRHYLPADSTRFYEPSKGFLFDMEDDVLPSRSYH